MSIQRVYRSRLRSNFVLGALVAPAFGCSGSSQASSDTLGNGSPSDGGADASTAVVLPVNQPGQESNADSSDSSADSPSAPPACLAPALACDAGCLTNDTQNCGACGNACPSAEGGAATCSASDGGVYSCGLTCSGGSTACAGACVDTSSDSRNCGACGYGCLHGACVAGSCEPWVVATGLGTSSALTTDGTTVAFYNGTAGFQAPLAGGTQLQLTPSFTDNGLTVAMAGGQVVFTSDNGASVSLMVATEGQTMSGTSSPTGSQNEVDSLALSPDGTTAYIGIQDPNGSNVDSCMVGVNAPCEPLFTPPTGSTGERNAILTAGGYLFATDQRNGKVWRYLLPSGPAESVLASGGLPYLAVDSTYLYWVSLNDSWTVTRVSQDDFTTTETVATIPDGAVLGLAVDDTNVYILGSSYLAYAPSGMASADAGAEPAVVNLFEGDALEGIAAGGGAVIWGDTTIGKIYAVRAP